MLLGLLTGGLNKRKINEIVNTFEKIGYDVSYKILDQSSSFWSSTI